MMDPSHPPSETSSGRMACHRFGWVRSLSAHADDEARGLDRAARDAACRQQRIREQWQVTNSGLAKSHVSGFAPGTRVFDLHGAQGVAARKPGFHLPHQGPRRWRRESCEASSNF